MSEVIAKLKIGRTEYDVIDLEEYPTPNLTVLDLSFGATRGLEGYLIPPNTRIRLSGVSSTEFHPSRVATKSEFEVLD